MGAVPIKPRVRSPRRTRWPLPYRVYNRTYRPTDVGRAARFSSIAYLAQYWLIYTLPPDRRTGPATAQDLKTTCARTRTDGGLGDFC